MSFIKKIQFSEEIEAKSTEEDESFGQSITSDTWDVSFNLDIYTWKLVGTDQQGEIRWIPLDKNIKPDIPDQNLEIMNDSSITQLTSIWQYIA